MLNEGILQGYSPIDYETVVIDGKARPETVFELFNGSVDAVEAETAYSIGVPSLEHGPLTFGAMRTREFCIGYDDFINDSDFKLDVFGVLKLEMENFWSSIYRNNEKRARYGENNSVRIRNVVKTYGGSTIYEYGNAKAVYGYLINNMTYDGQYSYVLTSVKVGGLARVPFRPTGRYPKSFDVIRDAETRWGKIVAKLESVGETAIGAWAVLESEDSRVFYGELKKHNWLSKQDKQLLKSIRKMEGGMTFDLYVESLEIRNDEIEAKLAELEQENEGLYLFIEDIDSRASEDETEENPKVLELLASIKANNQEIGLLQAELDEIEAKLVEFGEEDNSMSSDSKLEDYDNWNYYLGNGY